MIYNTVLGLYLRAERWQTERQYLLNMNIYETRNVIDSLFSHNKQWPVSFVVEVKLLLLTRICSGQIGQIMYH